MPSNVLESPSAIGINNAHSLLSQEAHSPEVIQAHRPTYAYVCVWKDIHQIINSNYFWVVITGIFIFFALLTYIY